MDPLSTFAAGAAIGGVAGKLMEKVCDYGLNWLRDRFEEHSPEVQRKVQQNTQEFVNELANKIKAIEEKISETENRTKIEIAFEDPAFWLLIKEALLSSAQTESREKHKILARIISERLHSEPESLLALTSNLACKAVASLTPKQLKILALIELIHSIRPALPKVPSPRREQWYIKWLREELSFLLPMGEIASLDLLHLESLSCVSISAVSYSLEFILCPEVRDRTSRPYGEFSDAFKTFAEADPLGKEIKQLWDRQHLASVKPTTLGKLIGICVHDELTNTVTSLEGWKP